MVRTLFSRLVNPVNGVARATVAASIAMTEGRCLEVGKLLG